MTEDASLYRRWRIERDASAFGALARRHADLVLDVARRVAGRSDWAADALQDALVALACDGTDRPAEVGVRAWLARTAILAARHRATSERSRARRERAAGAGRREVAVDAREEEAEAVRAALLLIDGEDAAVLTLRYLHGVSYGELATILDVAEPTARVRVHRALERLREASGVRDRDEATLAAVIAAAPHPTAGAATVEGAIATAVAHAGTAATLAVTGSGAGGTSGPATVVPMVTRRLLRAPFAAAASIALCLGAAGVLLALRPAERASPPSSSVQPRESQASASAGASLQEHLRGAGALPPADELAPSGPAPGPPAPTGVGASGEGAPPDPATPLRRVEFRLDLTGAKGRETTPIRITALTDEHAAPLAFERTATGVVARVAEGEVTLRTDDARAAVASIRTEVALEGPPLRIVAVPAVEDPRLDALALAVVDRKTKAPLPDAELEWLPGLGPEGILHADAQGRIRIRLGTRVPALEAVRTWFWRGTVREPAHRSFTPAARPRAGAPNDESMTDAELAELLTGGVVTVELTPWGDSGFVPRRIRFEDDAGAPVVGAYVHVAFAHIRALGAAATAQDAGEGFRRTDARGEIGVTFGYMTAFELCAGDVPLAAWGLVGEAWPSSGPRVLRVPRWADVEVTLDDVPVHAALSWSMTDARDALGAARVPADGPVVPPGLDDAYDVRCRDRGLAFPFVDVGSARGRVEGPDAAKIRVPVLVGATARLVVFAEGSGAPATDPERRRALELRPTAPGPLRIVARWNDLSRPP